MTEWDDLRQGIGDIDRKILDLYEERMKAVRMMARYKRETGMEPPEARRERCEWSAAADSGAGRLLQLLADLGAEERQRTVSARDSQGAARALKVAFQGIKGCYSEEAAMDYFRDQLEPVSLEGFENVFQALGQGQADRGVLPLENTSTGSIDQVYDLLAGYRCHIVGEYVLPVRHCLLGAEGASLEGLEEVFSHTQGFLQCEIWLSAPERRHWRRTPHYDTATSAALVAKLGDPAKAAIAGRQAARAYGLRILAEDIQTYSNNHTRFIVISRDPEVTSRCDKISLMFSVRNESGSLYRILAEFARYGLNLVKIESRPIPEKNWEYRFYVDLDGNLNEPGIQEALKAVEGQCLEYRLLGNYVKG